MEIKKFKAEGIPYAVSFAKMVYNHSLRDRQPNPEYNIFFDEYMNEAAIVDQVNSGRLAVWGAVLNNEVLGVAAMTSEGHITMLYVNPNCRGRKIARQLINTMKRAAGVEFGLRWVTVNATPAWTSTYFMKNGFKAMDFSQDYNSPFMSLRAKSDRIKEYNTKPFSWVKILVTSVIFLFLILGSTFGYIFYYLVTH